MGVALCCLMFLVESGDGVSTGVTSPVTPPLVESARSSIITGVIRDSVSRRARMGVVVLVDGTPRDTSDEAGRYSIDGLRPGSYTLRFVEPDYVAVLDGVSFDIALEVADVVYRLDVLWPPVAEWAVSRCDSTRGSRYGSVIVLGRVSGAEGRVTRHLRAEVSWSRVSGLPPSEGGWQPLGAFSAVAVRVQGNGGFLLCHLPAAQTVRLRVEDESGSSAGASRNLTLPTRGMITVTIHLPQEGQE